MNGCCIKQALGKTVVLHIRQQNPFLFTIQSDCQLYYFISNTTLIIGRNTFVLLSSCKNSRYWNHIPFHSR